MDELVALLEEKVALLAQKDVQLEALSRAIQHLTEQNQKLKCINDCLLTRKSALECCKEPAQPEPAPPEPSEPSESV